ncbi:unnamed protein product, partial [marine sediment metagenome]
GDVYAIACSHWARTVSVSADGLTLAEIQHDNVAFMQGSPPGFIPVSGNVYAIAYETTGGIGRLTTRYIENDGDLTGGNIDTLDFEPVRGKFPQIIYVTGNIYAIVCQGVGDDGWLHTVDIETVSAPTVSADPATDIAALSASLNGTLDDDGGAACDCGFEWGETVAYGNTTPTQTRTTGQTFAQAISGLSPGTLYHFRAFATNETGTSYSADSTFTTIGTPTATTDPATGGGMVLADLNGTLD